MVNNYLRGLKDNEYYPSEKDIPGVIDQIQSMSQAIQNNPLPEKLTTFRGTTDKFFSVLLQQNGLGKAVNKDGSVNYAWLKKNQKALRKNLVGKTFHDKAFTSTSTEKSFAQTWGKNSALREKRFGMLMNGQTDEYNAFEKEVTEHPERMPGAHLLTMNLPKGSKGAFVDRTIDGTANKGEVDQREVLLDKGSTFKISDIRKMKDADSYELVMDLLAEEEGVKKNSAPKEPAASPRRPAACARQPKPTWTPSSTPTTPTSPSWTRIWWWNCRAPKRRRRPSPKNQGPQAAQADGGGDQSQGGCRSDVSDPGGPDVRP